LLGFPVSVVSCFLFLLLFLLDTLLLSVSSRLIILNMQCLKGNYGGYLLGTLRLNNFAPHEVWDSVYDTLHDVIAQTYGDLLGLRGCNDALILIINGKPTSIVSVNQEDSGLRRRLPCLCVSACHKKEGTSKKGVLFLRQCRNDGSIATSLRALFGSKGPYIELEVSWR
jgi:hypothetical protein